MSGRIGPMAFRKLDKVLRQNVITSGVLRDGVTRRLLMEAPIGFLSPETMLGELNRHREAIASRAALPGDEFDLLLALLTERVEVVPRSDDASRMKEAAARMRQRDPGDVPFVALALALRCEGIWTCNRKHFEGTGVEVWATADVAACTRSTGGP